jgi:hypothetical protein
MQTGIIKITDQSPPQSPVALTAHARRTARHSGKYANEKALQTIDR